jgi:hypothetical protein
MDNWRDWFKQAATGLMDANNRFLMGQEVIPEERLEVAIKATEEWIAKLAPMVRLEKATLKDIKWWLRRIQFSAENVQVILQVNGCFANTLSILSRKPRKSGLPDKSTCELTQWPWNMMKRNYLWIRVRKPSKTRVTMSLNG